MTLMDAIEALGGARGVLYVVAFGVPVLVWGSGALSTGSGAGSPGERPGPSRGFGHVASALVALGLLTLVFEVLIAIYVSGQGTDLVAGVPALDLIAPAFFGLGTLFAATRRLPFAELRRYPLLRRVWSLLSAAGLVLIAFMVLKHTYWLVFSGIVGFVIVAIIAWTLLRKLVGRTIEPPPKGGDPDLFDEVADESRQRASRLTDAIGRRRR